MMELPTFIEIETSKLCNRKCTWCPVGVLNERKNQELMPWTLFEKIISDLKSVRYNRTIALHNYNEPLLNKRIFQEVKYINNNLTNCTVLIFTNGDFISNSIIQQLLEAKLDLLRITIYPSSIGISPSFASIEKWLKHKKVANLNWTYNYMDNQKGCFLLGKIGNMEIKIISPNINTYNTRADIIKPQNQNIRNYACNMTSVSAAIDYKGNFKMCCNIFSELDNHKQYIFGNLNEESFDDLWFSEKMNNLRIEQMKGEWSNSEICKYCFKLNGE